MGKLRLRGVFLATHPEKVDQGLSPSPSASTQQSHIREYPGLSLSWKQGSDPYKAHGVQLVHGIGHVSVSREAEELIGWRTMFPLLESTLALCLSFDWAWVSPLGVRASLGRALAEGHSWEGVVWRWHAHPTDCMSQAVPGVALALLSDDADT